ncbi:phosphate signaling complex protein PhoU [Pelagibaculum spongiae]|uniref:Phosphate-specific transport system accessory protein PhoU n=1 Tax=Pelagibaculum spongiae TaxID=2080658 RepID=A0A2V1GYU1_9GAMM|nr:phosphate signaling complex protein PhoU [Pelagibaculum spongiae]PVZ69805.1 phosphate transport system regulator PhoU [Pelagibaculum spongiae]
MERVSGQHISGQFNEELESIRNRVMVMGGLVEKQLEDATTALIKQDIAIAQHVVMSDHKINALEVSLDEECTQVIAKRQPTASDLRLIMVVIKTITDLERIGDEAERIGRMCLHINQTGAQKSQLASLKHIGRYVQDMLHEVLDALARMDADAAVRIAKMDEGVDREYESVMRQLMTYMMEDVRSIPGILDIMWSARALERIGDRCCNICEYIIYYVKGKDVRHTSIEAMESLVQQKR